MITPDGEEHDIRFSGRYALRHLSQKYELRLEEIPSCFVVNQKLRERFPKGSLWDLFLWGRFQEVAEMATHKNRGVHASLYQPHGNTDWPIKPPEPAQKPSHHQTLSRGLQLRPAFGAVNTYVYRVIAILPKPHD